ncbi:MAG: hypothetical protein QOF39_3539 [Frankiales bacterium]|nr:hypothetical protein [Frankiales bacterium]
MGINRRAWTAAAMVALTAVAGAGPALAAGSTVRSQVADDAAWLRQGQLPDGAIAWYVDKQRINPYLGNYAAIGLAEAHKVTGSAADLTAATAWLRWYAAHEDASGFVTDYTVSATGAEVSTGDMDSTDAYAGTFLLATRAVWRAGATKATIRSLSAGVAGAVSAIEATHDADGLTWAKPTWHVKYLMDTAESYGGLRAAADLASVLGNAALQARAAADASALSLGAQGLWNAATASYDWARHGDGSQTSTDWANLYPDSMEQSWAAAFGLAAPDRAVALQNTVIAAHPLWDRPGASDLSNGVPAQVGYWPTAGWALLRSGATNQAAMAATYIRTASLSTGRAWPFTTGTAGQLIVLESGDPSLVS